MGNLAPGRPVYNAALNFSYVDIVINIFASLLTLVLIWYMRRNGSLKINLYLKCVGMMTIHQLLYDASLTLNYPCPPASEYHECTAMFVGGFATGGVGASIWALMIIATTTFIVEFRRQPTTREKTITFTCVQLFIFAWGIVYTHGGYTAHDHMQYWTVLLSIYNKTRLVLIVITSLVLLWLYRRMLQLTDISKIRSASTVRAPSAVETGTEPEATVSSVGTGTRGETATISTARANVSVISVVSNSTEVSASRKKDIRESSPLYHLTRRLLFYPIVQIVCRLGSSPYLILYQSSFTAIPTDAGFVQIFFMFLAVGLAPTAGVGSFLVFLYMQHGAWDNLKKLCACDWSYNAAKDAGEEDDEEYNDGEYEEDERGGGEEGRRSWDSESRDTQYRDEMQRGSSQSRQSRQSKGTGIAADGSEWSRLSIMDESDLMKEYLNAASASADPSYIASASASAASSYTVDSNMSHMSAQDPVQGKVGRMSRDSSIGLTIFTSSTGTGTDTSCSDGSGDSSNRMSNNETRSSSSTVETGRGSSRTPSFMNPIHHNNNSHSHSHSHSHVGGSGSSGKR